METIGTLKQTNGGGGSTLNFTSRILLWIIFGKANHPTNTPKDRNIIPKTVSVVGAPITSTIPERLDHWNLEPGVSAHWTRGTDGDAPPVAKYAGRNTNDAVPSKR